MDKRVALALFSAAMSLGSWLATRSMGDDAAQPVSLKPDAAAVEQRVHVGDTLDDLTMKAIIPDKTLPTPGDPDSMDWVFVDKSGKTQGLLVRVTAGVVSEVERL